MAEYLPIRAINRSQNVRINKQRITSTATAYIDLSNATAKREYQHHSAIGAVFIVGPITANNETYGIVNGGKVTFAEALKVNVSEGTLRNRSTGVTVDIEAKSKLALSAASGANPRIDIIEVKIADGSVKKKDGTAAASPVAPEADEGYYVLAEILVPKEATEISAEKITDKRKFV